MIQVQLQGNDEVDDKYISLVAAPRIGDYIEAPLISPYKLRVTEVIFLANTTGMKLWVEFVH